MRVVWTVKVVQWDLLVHTVPVTTSGPDGTKIPIEVDLLRAVWERCKRYQASDFTTTEPDIWQILMGGRRSAGVVV